MRRILNRDLHRLEAPLLESLEQPGALVREWGHKQEGIDAESHDGFRIFTQARRMQTGVKRILGGLLLEPAGPAATAYTIQVLRNDVTIPIG